MAIVGHRGSSIDSPENTVQSQRACFGKGIKGAEFDVQLSTDGEIFLMHDETLERTADPVCPPALCGDGGPETQESYTSKLKHMPVSNLSYSAFLEHVDVGSQLRHGKRETVPLMKELMRETVSADNFVFAELKRGETVKLVDAMVALVSAEAWLPRQLIFISFDFRVLWLLKQKLPDFKGFFIACGGPVQAPNCPTPHTAEETVAIARYPGIASVAFEDALSKGYGLAEAAAAGAAEAMEAARANRPESIRFDGIDLMASKDYATAEVVGEAKEHDLEVAVWVWNARHIPPDGGDSLENAGVLMGHGVDYFTSNLPGEIVEHANGGGFEQEGATD